LLLVKKASRPVTRPFSRTAKWLHWIVAFLMLSILSAAMGFAFTAPADRAAAIPAHASLGLVVVMLTLVRLAWRSAVPPPPLPGGTPGWMQRGASLGHFLLYALILYQGVIGIWMAALSPVSIRLFGGFDLSALSPPSAGALVVLRQFHFAGACLLALVIFGHVAAALWHHFRLRDDVLIRMLPFGGLWQRLSAPDRAREARMPSRTGRNWPKKLPPKGTPT
jgi:cytochrome b561